MIALALVSVLALPAAPFGMDDDEPGPSKEKVRAAVERLEEAFDAEKPDETVSGIQNAMTVAAPEVVAVLEKRGLAHEQLDVVRASIEALGLLDHEDALEVLTKFHKKERKELGERERQELNVPLLQAIARHGDEDSIPLLVEDMFRSPQKAIVQARILGLAQIRSRESVVELMSVMRKIDRKKIQGQMNNFRLAFIVLTGVDHGTSQDRWTAWWNDNKKTFTVAEAAPRMPEDLQNRWNRYWGLQRQYDRQKRRGDRGDDDDRDGL